MSKGGVVETELSNEYSHIHSNLEKSELPPYYLECFEKVQLVIPTLNEEKTIGKLLNVALEYLPPENILVIDGNSTDLTEVEVKSRSVPFYSQKSFGKGGALIEAMELFPDHFETIVFIDGDLTYHLEDLEKLVKPIQEDEIDLVIGDRLRGDREEGAITKFNVLGNWTFSLLIKLLYGGKLTDTQTGYRALSRKAINNMLPYLDSISFEIETEMNIVAQRKNLDVKTVPIKYTKRPEGSETKLDPIKVGWRIIKKIITLRFKSL